MTQEIYDNMCQSLETLYRANLTKGLSSIQVEMVLMSFQIILNENLELSKRLKALEEQVQKFVDVKVV
jgi:hypothetical protein